MSDLKPFGSGYMKPPRNTRFKPGQSGNSKGRPKVAETPYTALQKVLKRKVVVKGQDRKIRLDEALIRRLRELALSGDRRAVALQQKILEMSGANQTDPSRDKANPNAAKDRFMQMLVETRRDTEKEKSNG